MEKYKIWQLSGELLALCHGLADHQQSPFIGTEDSAYDDRPNDREAFLIDD